MNTLTFNGNTLTTIDQEDQIWLTSSELATALGYKTADSVTRIFNRNKDEFSSNMTRIVETVKLTASCKTKALTVKSNESTESVVSSKTKGLRAKIRIFSLRGCHLLAMFARTDIAKAFRVWVLDILEREVKTTSHQRIPLRQACDRLAVGNMLISDAYKVVTSHYGVEHIDQIPESKLPEAVAFVYDVILAKKEDVSTNQTYSENVGNLVRHMYYISSWFRSVRVPLNMMNPAIVSEVSGHMTSGVFSAQILNGQIAERFNPMISNDVQWSVKPH